MDNKPLTYNSAHRRVSRLWGPASRYCCFKCQRQASQWAYDGTDSSELLGHDWYSARRQDALPMRYSQWPEFYAPMCRSCHKERDLEGLPRPFRRGRVGDQRERHIRQPRTEAEWDEYMATHRMAG